MRPLDPGSPWNNNASCPARRGQGKEFADEDLEEKKVCPAFEIHERLLGALGDAGTALVASGDPLYIPGDSLSLLSRDLFPKYSLPPTTTIISSESIESHHGMSGLLNALEHGTCRRRISPMRFRH